MLEHYVCTDDVERRHMLRLGELIARGEGPFANDRGLLPPVGAGHLTASVFVVVGKGAEGDEARVLMLEHAKLGRLLQPGGHFEPGESDPRVAAARELLEETGIGVEPGALELLDFDIHTIPASAKRGEPEHAHFDVRYVLWLAEAPVVEGVPADPAPLRWVRLGEVGMGSSDGGIARVAGKLRSLVARR